MSIFFTKPVLLIIKFTKKDKYEWGETKHCNTVLKMAGITE